MTYPLSLDKFKSWLQSKDENEIVGEKRKCSDCPVASAIKDTVNKFSGIHVSGNKTGVAGVYYENPSWVLAFLDKVDASYNPQNITAKKALHILDNLHICTVCSKYNPEGKNCGKENCDR